MKKNSFCSYCGTKLIESNLFPKRCENCKQITYINPIPVCVMIVPYKNYILGVRRGIQPGKGMPALPGGFVDGGESWQEAGARELWEEIQVRISPNSIREFAVHSTDDKRLILIFGISQHITTENLLQFTPSEEATERLFLGGSEELAFPLHQEMMKKYFLSLVSTST
jgi:ADP-ribose pyrophosphatase YjhB (NUDIX family)